jgi:predicted cupin superfamily sugar epimerase
MNLETRPTANEIKSMLGLERHPTCGFVAETYRSALQIPPVAYESDRPNASELYFLVTPDALVEAYPDLCQEIHAFAG